MKLDVHHDYGPVIRLHDFDHTDLERFRATVADLACAARAHVPLHEEPYVEPLEGCRLTLHVGETDQGLQPESEPNLFGWVSQPGIWEPFTCTLSPEGWTRVGAGIDLLLHLRFLCSEYVWLHRQWTEHSDIAWLLSPDGEW